MRGKEIEYLSHTTLTGKNGELLRVHWHPLHMKRTDAGYSLSTFVSPANARETGPLLPSHTGLLAHLIVSGIVSDERRLLADVAAAHQIISFGDVDWGTLLRLAKRYSFGTRLFSICSYLRSRLSVPIPSPVLRELAGRHVSMAERFERRLARRGADLPDSFFGPLTRLAARYARYSHGTSTAKAIVSIPQFLRHYYHIRSLPRIVTRVAGNGVRRIARLATTMQSTKIGDERRF
jgi:hypothetical protein